MPWIPAERGWNPFPCSFEGTAPEGIEQFSEFPKSIPTTFRASSELWTPNIGVTIFGSPKLHWALFKTNILVAKTTRAYYETTNTWQQEIHTKNSSPRGVPEADLGGTAGADGGLAPGGAAFWAESHRPRWRGGVGGRGRAMGVWLGGGNFAYGVVLLDLKL